MTHGITLWRWESVWVIAAVAGSAMATCASAGPVQIAFAVSGEAWPEAFATGICAVLHDEIARDQRCARVE